MKNIKLLIAGLLIFLILINTNNLEKVMAESAILLSNVEISNDLIEGTSSHNGEVEVKIGQESIGRAEIENNQFQVSFSRRIPSTTLSLLFYQNGQIVDTKMMMFEPVEDIKPVNDKEKRLSGKSTQNATVSATVNSTQLILKNHNIITGEFEFHPHNNLHKGNIITIFSEKNGIKSISETKVVEAPLPDKPILNPVSNKDSFIIGQAEKNSTVYVEVSNGKTYYTKLQDSISFKITLDQNKPLREGTKITAYVIDSVGRKSGKVTFTVLDKVPPAKPIMNTISDKSFLISGKVEAGTTVYVYKNSKLYVTLISDSKGNFNIPIPLQVKGTSFEAYSIDGSKNKSLVSKVIVTPQTRLSRKLLSAPLIRQMPELPRGCEVTSLAMLLNYAGVNVNKMTLAKEVTKDLTPYKTFGGRKYFGNPHLGFVGNMYTFNKPGFGVFNKPVASLANKYLPNRIVNLSGQSFDHVLNYVSAGRPVWIINTSWFSIVPNQYWQTWYTPQGPVRITMKEHSVLVTGYDSNYVYFNDPLDGSKNKRKPIKKFVEGWKQFGSQAISYY